jgi:hypothetical protein
MAGKNKVPERRSGLRPSEKALPERRSGAFRHKNTPVHTHAYTNHWTPGRMTLEVFMTAPEVFCIFS